MTTRQAKHQAKQRLEGAVKIDVTFRADEPAGKSWKEWVEYYGSPKLAMAKLLEKMDNI